MVKKMDCMDENDALYVFKPILEELRQLICEKEIKTEKEKKELVQTVSLVSTIGVEQLEIQDINSILNVVLKFIKENTDQFPSLPLLDFVKRCLEHIRQKELKLNIVPFSWPFDLRVLILRLFQTFKLPEEYIIYCYELASLASRALGLHWLQTDPQFSSLLASLASGRLRIIMENPDNIKLDQLIACLILLEDFIQSIEDDDDDLLNDTDATSIGKSCQEAAVYIIECVMALDSPPKSELEQSTSASSITDTIPPESSAEKSTHISVDDIFQVLFRYLSVFFAIDGAKIIDSKLIDQVKPVLLKICSNNPEKYALFRSIFEDL